MPHAGPPTFVGLFPHLLFEWVLGFNGWTYVALAASETFEALTQ
jgi:hypothetical protein